MSDSEENSPAFTLSTEVKQLRAQLMALKKSATRGDKKQKRAVEEEVTRLEQLIESKQATLRELKTVEPEAPQDNQQQLEQKRQAAKEKKEKKLKVREAAWEANRQAAVAEAAGRPDWQGQEAAAFAHRLQERGFKVLEVAADGHCLFGAIGCQLPQVQDHWRMRGVAADWMLRHSDSFAPFLELEKCSFEEYCQTVRSSGQWGGQMELEALAQALPARIIVIQAAGEDLLFGPEDAEILIYLSYHRHAFSLGEHYNALIKKAE